MAIKQLTVSSKRLKDSDRLEPKFHRVFSKLDYKKSDKFHTVKLGDDRILKKITDGEHAGQTFVKKGIRFIKNSAVKDFSININDGFFITEEKHKLQNRSALKPLDILFTTIGHLGSAAIVSENLGEANINQNVVKLEINEKFIDPYYLTAYLNSSVTKNQIDALFTGNIHKILTYPKIKNIRIGIPNKQFQKEIANEYQRAIDYEHQSNLLLKKAEAALYKNLDIDFKKIKHEKIFSVKLSNFKNKLWNPACSLPLYVDTLREIKKTTQTTSLKEIAVFKKGNEVGSKNYNTYLDKKVDDVPFIRTSDIYNSEVDQFPDFYISKEIYEEINQDLQSGDILYTNDGKIGLVAMMTPQDKCIIQSHIKRIRLNQEAKLKHKLTEEYLFLVLSLKEIGGFQAKKNTVVQSTIPTISNRIGDIEIPILKPATINELTEVVKKCFQLKDQKKKLISKIKEKIDNYFQV